MNKCSIISIVLLLLAGCSPKPLSFDRFEISYYDDKNANYSFMLFPDSNFNFKTGIGDRGGGGKLTENEMKELKTLIAAIENNKSKTIKEDCRNCQKISVKIDRKHDTLKVIQSGNIDIHLKKLHKRIENLMQNKATYFLKPGFEYITDKDLLLLE